MKQVQASEKIVVKTTNYGRGRGLSLSKCVKQPIEKKNDLKFKDVSDDETPVGSPKKEVNQNSPTFANDSF